MQLEAECLCFNLIYQRHNYLVHFNYNTAFTAESLMISSSAHFVTFLAAEGGADVLRAIPRPMNTKVSTLMKI